MGGCTLESVKKGIIESLAEQLVVSNKTHKNKSADWVRLITGIENKRPLFNSKFDKVIEAELAKSGKAGGIRVSDINGNDNYIKLINTITAYVENNPKKEEAESVRKTPEFDKLPSYVEGQRNMTYAGIGSRETPAAILKEMTRVSKELADRYKLQTGYKRKTGNRIEEEGADKAFSDGTTNKELFGPDMATKTSVSIAHEIYPNLQAMWDYVYNKWVGEVGESKAKSYADGAVNLQARNTLQVFGANLDTPVDFVLFYAKETSNPMRPAGGTGQAVEMARRKGIPTINMIDDNWEEQVMQIVNKEEVKIEIVDKYTREEVKTNPKKLYLYGENITYTSGNNSMEDISEVESDFKDKKYPNSTQAAIRGLGNAAGIITKLDEFTNLSSYITTEKDINKFIKHFDMIIGLINKEINAGKFTSIVFPKAGIGTGKANLKENAPRLYNHIAKGLNKLSKNSEYMPLVKIERPDSSLTEEQQVVHDSIVEFFNSDRQEHILDAAGGTGKTYTIGKVAETFKAGGGKEIQYLAPTHVAKLMLMQSSGGKAITVASGLGIKLNEATGEFKNDPDAPANISNGDYLVIDESSMLTESLYSELLKAVGEKGKILFMGDRAQLPPIRTEVDKAIAKKGGYEISPSLISDSSNIGSSTLTKVMRFDGESTIGTVTEALRSNSLLDDPKPSGKILKDIKLNGNVELVSTVEAIEDKFIEDYKKSPMESVIVTYNNQTNTSRTSVMKLNASIRKKLAPDSMDVYVEGDVLVSYNSLSLEGQLLVSNSERMEVISIKEPMVQTFRPTNGKRSATVEMEVQEAIVKHLSFRNNETVMVEEKVTIATPKAVREFNLKQKELLEAKNPEAYTRAGVFSQFVLETQFGYAITSHKSQGQTFDNVYVMLDNIEGQTRNNAKDRAAATYVAMSRPRDKLVIHSTGLEGVVGLDLDDDTEVDNTTGDNIPAGITDAKKITDKKQKVKKPWDANYTKGIIWVQRVTSGTSPILKKAGGKLFSKVLNFGNPFVVTDIKVAEPILMEVPLGTAEEVSVMYYKWLKNDIIPEGYPNNQLKVLAKRREFILKNLGKIRDAKELIYWRAPDNKITHVDALVAIANEAIEVKTISLDKINVDQDRKETIGEGKDMEPEKFRQYKELIKVGSTNPIGKYIIKQMEQLVHDLKAAEKVRGKTEKKPKTPKKSLTELETDWTNQLSALFKTIVPEGTMSMMTDAQHLAVLLSGTGITGWFYQNEGVYADKAALTKLVKNWDQNNIDHVAILSEYQDSAAEAYENALSEPRTNPEYLEELKLAAEKAETYKIVAVTTNLLQESLENVLEHLDTQNHELGHGILLNFIRKNPTHPLVKELNRIFAESKEKAQDLFDKDPENPLVQGYSKAKNPYWMTNTEEFTAEMLSKPELLIALNKLYGKDKTAGDKGIGAKFIGALVALVKAIAGTVKAFDANSLAGELVKTMESMVSEQVNNPEVQTTVEGAVANALITEEAQQKADKIIEESCT